MIAPFPVRSPGRDAKTAARTDETAPVCGDVGPGAACRSLGKARGPESPRIGRTSRAEGPLSPNTLCYAIVFGSGGHGLREVPRVRSPALALERAESAWVGKPEIAAGVSVMPILARMKSFTLGCRPPWPFTSGLDFIISPGNKIMSRPFLMTAELCPRHVIASAAGGILPEIPLPDLINPRRTSPGKEPALDRL